MGRRFAVLAARRHVRQQSQYASDSVLLSESRTGFFSPCRITPFTSEKLRNELNNFLAGQASGLVTGGYTALLAREALGVQLPDKVTEFALGK